MNTSPYTLPAELHSETSESLVLGVTSATLVESPITHLVPIVATRLVL